jgi:TolB protein
MNADGSGERKLTSDTGFDSYPAWSPDGRRIAFASGRDGSSGIYVINVDGTEQRLLMPAAVTYPAQLAWSPNGERIAFTIEHPKAPAAQTRNLEIYIVNADGSGQRRLTRSPAWDDAPAWSPDGRTIAFVSDVSIYVMNADGSGQRELTPGGSPAWSPDGRKIAFVRGDLPRDGNSDLYVVNADGRDLRRLTRSPAWDWAPAWSPGQKK